ncbi:MAG: histidinol dehydrogenase [Gammaproteobacteria bacterium]|nr:MAG: histidinol dehydrogenase [Gammaproteobacteria bacterium]
MLDIRRLSSQDADFSVHFNNLLQQNQSAENDVRHTVESIIKDIRENGDNALLAYTKKFDHVSAAQVSELEISKQQMQEALTKISAEQSQALVAAAKRIRDYAEKQSLQSWSTKDDDGNEVGQVVTALERVGVYVPGGKAAYPSSVLMNVIPAKVAGVDSIIMVVPTPSGEINSMVMAAASIAGVDRVFTIGGAQAVAALAYGTETIPQVDKIVGPGNAYVASAKQQVFGKVGIDMIAGPSEVLVICDSSANPEWVAMDLFSQAEHDANARAILISNDVKFFDQVQQQMELLLKDLDHTEIIIDSINNFGAFIQVSGLDEAAELSNQIAPEHLELCVANPEELLKKIRNAGAIFLGHYSPEVFGDYCAGPNHVLPTAGTARFSSPLGVYDFQKRTSVVNCSKQGANKLSSIASTLAHGEGLTAHARSADFRRK